MRSGTARVLVAASFQEGQREAFIFVASRGDNYQVERIYSKYQQRSVYLWKALDLSSSAPHEAANYGLKLGPSWHSSAWHGRHDRLSETATSSHLFSIASLKSMIRAIEWCMIHDIEAVRSMK